MQWIKDAQRASGRGGLARGQEGGIAAGQVVDAGTRTVPY